MLFFKSFKLAFACGMHSRLLPSQVCNTLLEVIYLWNSLKPWMNASKMSFMNYLSIRQSIHSNQNTLILNNVLCFRPLSTLHTHIYMCVYIYIYIYITY